MSITATPTEARRSLDALAVRTAVEAISIHDTYADTTRMRDHVENAAVLLADRLASSGLDLHEASAAAQHLTQAAGWCLTVEGETPEEILHGAVVKAAVISEVTGDARAAAQCATWAGLTAALKVLDEADLEAFTPHLMLAVEAAVGEVAGRA